MGQKIKEKGGGWYFLEDDTTIRLSKKAIEEGGYEVVESFDAGPEPADSGTVDPDAAVEGASSVVVPSQANDLSVSQGAIEVTAEPELGGLDDGSVQPTDTGIVVDQFKPLPGSQLPIGPFRDYVYAATPYGEFGIPAGKTIVAFREVKDWEGKRSYRAVYGGEGLSRSEKERLEWIAMKESERVALAEAGRN